MTSFDSSFPPHHHNHRSPPTAHQHHHAQDAPPQHQYPLSSPAVRIPSFPTQIRPRRGDDNRSDRGSVLSGSVTSNYYRARSPLSPPHHHHHQVFSPTFPNSPPVRHNHPVNMHSQRDDQEPPCSATSHSLCSRHESRRPQLLRANSHQPRHHTHRPLSPILTNAHAQPVTSHHSQYPRSLPNQYSGTMHFPPPTFAGMPHGHLPGAGLVSGGMMGGMMAPSMGAAAMATMAPVSASMMNPVGAHR